MTSTFERDLQAPLARVVRSFGLPSLSELTTQQDRLATRHLQGRLVDGQLLQIVVPRTGLPRRPIAHIRASLRALRQAEEAIPSVFRTAWVEELQSTVLLRSLPEGRLASLILSSGTTGNQAVYGAIGRYLARRPQQFRPAGWADAHGFQTMRSFRNVMVRSASITENCLRVSGLDPGPAADEVFARFADALERAEFPAACALTHGGLGAYNARMKDGEIVEFDGWTQAMMGDPLYEWGALHHMGQDAVDWAVLGAEGLVRDPHRLAVGFFGKLVNDLGTFAALCVQSSEPQRSELTAFARNTLERSLEVAPLEWDCTRVSVSPPAVWHRIADAIRSVPPPDARDSAFLAGAIAALECEALPPSDRTELATRYLGALRPRLVAPAEHGQRATTGHPLVLRIQSAVEGAFAGQPPFGLHAAVWDWSSAMRMANPTDAFQALREALVLQWCGRPVDPEALAGWWEIVNWRVEEDLTVEEALGRAQRSSDPLDICRVLGALRITNGPPTEALLGSLFTTE